MRRFAAKHDHEKASFQYKKISPTNKLMKNTTMITMAALLLGSSGLFAAESAYTKPSGFVTHTLKAGQFNLIGLTLHEAVTVSGAFTEVDGTTLTDGDVDFDSVLTPGKTYILEITSGALAGTIQEMAPGSWSGNTLTTTDDLSSSLTISNKYQMRESATLESILGTIDSSLIAGFSVASADVVWLPTAGGEYRRYYLKRPSNVWWNADSNIAAPDVSVCYTDALFIQKKGSEDSDLVLTGSVKTISTIAVMENGFTPISAIFPVGTTLLSSGLEASLTAGFSVASSDVLWVPADGGTYTRYYVKRPADAWTKINADSTQVTVDDSDDFAMPSGFFIQRKSTRAELKIDPPSSYSDL